MKNKYFINVPVSALLVLAAANLVFAQSTTGVILGTVTDSSGAVVTGAALEIRNLGTGTTQSTSADDQGRFRVPELRVGEYEVQAAHAGFQTVVRKGITLTVGSEAIVDIALPIGQSQQTVLVEAQASQVDTTSASVASLVEQAQLRELPLNGRNFEQLLTLATGVQQLPNSGGLLYGAQSNYSVAGSRPAGQQYLIDNTNFAGWTNHGTGSAATGSSLGMEGIAEFQTLTNTYSAQFGGSGAAVNAVTRSGTNSYHGSAYEYLRNSAFDARNFFDTVRRPGETFARVPAFRRNQFGTSLGGPIRKEKAFFYVNYEDFIQRLASSDVATLPDANAKKGYLPCVTAPTYGCDKSTGLAYVGVAQTTASTLAAYKTGINPLGGGIASYTQALSTATDEYYLLARMDYNLSAKDSLFVRYVRDRAEVKSPPLSPDVTLYTADAKTQNDFITTEWKHIVSPTLVTLLRASFLRPVEIQVTPQSDPALQWFPGEGRTDGQVIVAGLSNLGPAQNNPFYLVPNHFVEGGDAIWSRGAHNIRFGVTFDRIQNNITSNSGAGGQYTFPGLLALLQGNATLFSGPVSGLADVTRDARELRIQPYFHDEWKFNRRLTLNLGVRYEWMTNPTERRNKLTTLVNAPYGAYQPVSHVFANNPTNTAIGPRIGFAYDVFGDHKTALRGGFGIFHDTTMAGQYTTSYQRTPPFALSQQQTAIIYGQPFKGGPATNPIPSNVNGTDYKIGVTPYVMQYNLNVQRELIGSTTLTVGYVGSRGVHLLGLIDLNPPVPTLGANGYPSFASLQNGKIVTNPRINPNFGVYLARETWGSSNYNSLQASLNRRFSSRLQAQASYTYSRSMDYGSANSNQGAVGGAITVEDPYNTKIEYGRSSFDRAQTFRISGIYGLPTFRNALENALLGDWQLSGLFSMTSPAPFTIQTGFDSAGLQAAATGGSTTRPVLLPGKSNNPVTGDPNRWFDPTAFTLAPIGQYGNLGRSTAQGPNLRNVDLALAKNFKVKRLPEQLGFQLRAEAFNVLNRTNFALPNIGAFASAPNGGFTVAPTAGQITTTVTPARQIQFALRLTF